MYTAAFNKFVNDEEVINFIRKYSFGTIVTTVNGLPEATHLPFLIELRDNKVVLISHFAKANTQAAAIVNETSLVIFTEPHAYISTSNYEKETNVPTWNYIAVHAYGKAVLITDNIKVDNLLRKTISYYELDYLKQWDSLSEAFKLKMMNGIVAFEIVVDNLQAKKKLSQNRTEVERAKIIDNLGKSADKNEQEIARYMKRT
ncbi:FMN-binding negative transcriptional regulator [Mucilaginibacter segetis]|uniref:FMN-binding negative transcriptional regulator n=1 Tax=Mucilaginibacter segetis TaxID=2793071 RepID=A0A934UMC7_9SPHI|nr:FMN-binding negative transcriptional regulator [Mucilaginibacter segetis]MBK0379508.1 FMN-binding negative transcriptional regulator [Mucilaginibacter segetis]